MNTKVAFQNMLLRINATFDLMSMDPRELCDVSPCTYNRYAKTKHFPNPWLTCAEHEKATIKMRFTTANIAHLRMVSRWRHQRPGDSSARQAEKIGGPRRDGKLTFRCPTVICLRLRVKDPASREPKLAGLLRMSTSKPRSIFRAGDRAASERANKQGKEVVL